MKKLMIALAAVACAFGLQASSCDWKLSTGGTYAGQNVYAFVNTSAQALLEACQSTDSADWSKLVAGLTPVTAGTGSRGVASSTIEGVTTADTLSFLIVNGAVAEGSAWAVVGPAAITKIYDPPATGAGQTFALNVAGSGTFQAAGPVPPGPDPIPEPTSAMLLLLGVAGLALRRRV